jgi:tetratricopeptide (TPR) repeat protein
MSLNAFPKAAQYFREAADLDANGAALDGDFFLNWGLARLHFETAGEHELDVARKKLKESGDFEGVAIADYHRIQLMVERREMDAAIKAVTEAYALAAHLPATPGKVLSFTSYAGYLGTSGRMAEAAAVLVQALAFAESVGDDGLTALVQMRLALIRGLLGDSRRGIEDLRRSVELAESARSPIATEALFNLGAMLVFTGDLPSSEAVYQQASHVAERYGDSYSLDYVKGALACNAYLHGQWEEALAHVEALLSGPRRMDDYDVLMTRTRIQLARSLRREAWESIVAAVQAAEDTGEAYRICAALALAARVAATTSAASVDALVERCLDAWGTRMNSEANEADLAATAVLIGRPELLLDAIRRNVTDTPWTTAARHMALGDFVEAGRVYAQIGSHPDEAYAHLQAGKRLIEQGCQAAGQVQLEKSLAFWRRVEASAYICECETLLARAESA